MFDETYLNLMINGDEIFERKNSQIFHRKDSLYSPHNAL